MAKKQWQGEEWLVCKCCGYKQYDVGTVLQYKVKYPGMAAHDIPYECGACMDNEIEDDDRSEKPWDYSKHFE